MPATERENNEQVTIKELIMRIIEDEEFKAKFVENFDDAVEEYDLSETQRMLLQTLTIEDIEKLTPENLEEFFSAESAVYTPDMDDDAFDDADEEDF